MNAKRIFYISALVMISFVNMQGQTTSKQPFPFAAGESLTYLIHYGIINGGVATMELKRVPFEGHKILKASAVAETTGIVKALYPVYDIYESYMDLNTGLPVKAVRNISEGKYRYYNEVTYNRENNTIHSQKSGKKEVPEGIMDIISAFYMLRTMVTDTLKPGDIINIQTYFGDELYPLIVRYRGKDVIRSKLGKIPCHKFAPVTEPGRVFKDEDDLVLWLSDDENFIPVRVELDMVVGSFRCDLIEYKGIVYPFNEAKK